MKGMKYCRAGELDHILASNRPFEEFNRFWNKNHHNFDKIIPRITYQEMLFMPSMLNAYTKEQLLSLAPYVPPRYICAILLDPNIPCDIRGFFWHYLERDISYHVMSKLCLDVCFREYSYCVPADVIEEYSENERKFFDAINYKPKHYAVLDSLIDALKNDSMSTFEMTRFMNGKKFTKTLFLLALEYSGKKTVSAMIEKYSEKIFTWHTPEEWLYIICNGYDKYNTVSIPAIRLIEEKFPGTVKNAKDPWGANLLWNTFFCIRSYRDRYRVQENLQKELLRLGCDPDEKNNLGLSFNLVMENSPESWRRRVSHK